MIIYRKYFYIILLASLVSSAGFSSNTKDQVLVKVRNLDFEGAYELLEELDDTNLVTNLGQYIGLFELNCIQKKSEVREFNQYNKEIILPSTNPVDYLIDGYMNLFIYNSRAKSYKSFLEGKDLLGQNDFELKKAFLLGLFKVINERYETAFDDFKDLLEDYREIISDNNDKFWYHYYNIELNDLMASYNKNSHDNFNFYRKQLDSLNLLKRETSNNGIQALINIINGNFYIKYDSKRALGHYVGAESQVNSMNFLIPYRFRIELDKGRCLKGMGNHEDAISHFFEAKELIHLGNTMTNRLNYSFFIGEYYDEVGNADSSNYYLKEERRLVNISNYIEANRQMDDLRVELETAEKEKQLLLQTQKTKANRNWLIAATLALLLGTGIAILLQKNTTKKRQLAEQEALLRQQRVENLLKEQELVSIDAMIAGQEKERQKVAGELHDDLGSLMATIKLHFDNAKVGKKDPALQNAQKLLEEAYQKIRGMAHSKNSGVMSNQGLLSAIKKMAKTITQTNALEVTVEDFGLGERLENSLELSIFRMVQELVANAIKHAEASKVNIQLTQHEDNLNIIVEDNGKGFDRSKLDAAKSGMGLTNIERRVEHLEGNFTVDSILGKGTSILIDIPV